MRNELIIKARTAYEVAEDGTVHALLIVGQGYLSLDP
jgi:hypothetical protein